MAAGGGGGAWKVAYADFVTAMMALFMVLWISAQDKKILIATSKYFQSPFASPMDDHSGIMPFNKQSDDNSNPKQSENSGADSPKNKDKQIELSFLNSVAADFYRLLHLDQNLEEKPIDIQVTSDGLRITMFNRSKQPIFKDDGVEFTEFGIHLLQSMAWLIDRNHFRVTIDGHTREGMKMPREDYSAWELSADRANAARRKLVYYAVEPEQIERVTGYAATRPLPNEPATAESNQRVTLSLSLTHKDKEKPKPVAAKPAPASPAARARAEEAPTFVPPSAEGLGERAGEVRRASNPSNRSPGEGAAPRPTDPAAAPSLKPVATTVR